LPAQSSITRRGWLCASFAATCLLLAGTARPAAPESGAFDIARYHGRVVVVDFWASWCKPCRQSIPWLNEMRSRYGQKGLVIVGINVDAKRADAQRFLETTPIDFDIFFDTQGELAQRYSLKGMPSSLVFDRDGKLVATHIGFQEKNKDSREASLRQLIDKAAS
jgi:cytochrome c biogenesis protein CcmG, thiol:disulfide interchange protein DsbE